MAAFADSADSGVVGVASAEETAPASARADESGRQCGQVGDSPVASVSALEAASSRAALAAEQHPGFDWAEAESGQSPDNGQ